MAKNKGIDVISITDHDTIDGVRAGQEVADRFNVGFIRGVELSCSGVPDAHIIGYAFDLHNEKMITTLSTLAKHRAERNTQIIDFLKSKNVDIALDEVQAVEPTTRMLGKPHFAQVLLAKGYVSTLEHAYEKYFNSAKYKEAIKRSKPTSEEGIDLITQAGGISVLAHPGFLKLEPNAFERYLDNLIANGLLGLECYYSEHSAEQTEYFISVAKKRKLLITGGSDFHGEKYKPGLEMGSVAFDLDTLSHHRLRG